LAPQPIGATLWVQSCRSILFIVNLRCSSVSLHARGRPAYDKIIGYIQKAKDAGGEILAGGTGDDSKGYFIQPTVILSKDPKSITLREEIFGPVVTVRYFPLFLIIRKV
jgi:hypothetical protein